MCEAFAAQPEVASVELWLPERKRERLDDDVYAFYSAKKTFSIRKILLPFNAFSSRFLGRLAYYLEASLFLLCLLFHAVPKNVIVYTRSPEVVWLYGKRRTVVYGAHGWPDNKERLYVWVMKRASYVVCNSRGTEEVYQTHGFTQTMVAPNGVDLDAFEIQGRNVDLRKELGLSDDVYIVLYTGHLYDWKGVDTLCQAAKNLGSEYAVVCVGGTKDAVATYQEWARQHAVTNLHFLGHKPRAYIPGYLRDADVLILPNKPISEESIRYTSPIKLFEYMASGTPIVASNLQSIREIVNNDSAFFFIPGSAEDLESTIRYVKEHPSEASSRAEVSCTIVTSYTWTKRARKIITRIV
jgi:glycosyltransferase involved in cell wall biosynthesis